MAHRFHHEVDRLRRMIAELPYRVGFDDVEDLADRRAARAWWRRRDQHIASIDAFDGWPFGDGVVGEILLAELAAMSAAGRDDRIGDLAAIEGVSTALGNEFQRVGKIFLDEAFSGLPRLSVMEKNCRNIRLTGEVL